MGKNSSGPTVEKTCVVILRNNCFFIDSYFTCVTLCSSTSCLWLGI